MSRKIEDLSPEMQGKAKLFQSSMNLAGIDFIFTCTFRSQAEQNGLWAQGRTKPGKKVTWTTLSKHTDRTAFDIAVKKDGEITWNPEDYRVPGEMGEMIGLEWGGRWKPVDPCHFQLKGA